MKLKRRAKQRLDELQAKLVLTFSRKLPQEKILEAIIDFACEHEEEFLRLLAGVQPPLSKEDVEILMKLPMDWGVETREEEIDRLLYGEGERER